MRCDDFIHLANYHYVEEIFILIKLAGRAAVGKPTGIGSLTNDARGISLHS